MVRSTDACLITGIQTSIIVIHLVEKKNTNSPNVHFSVDLFV